MTSQVALLMTASRYFASLIGIVVDAPQPKNPRRASANQHQPARLLHTSAFPFVGKELPKRSPVDSSSTPERKSTW
ncbi:hypothetical protein C6V83_18020 [Gordonia iterans]|uniref:Uncharacterized protein n=1 Tax=Gordonia iterans TaxID=1004901 RepID=A0A2S0KJL2_9ACTN|nr:hypothetical protein C6V83_18020 [Gordonia iterans]